MNGTFLVTGSSCGSAKVWNVEDGKFVTTLLKNSTCRINAIKLVGPRHIYVG